MTEMEFVLSVKSIISISPFTIKHKSKKGATVKQHFTVGKTPLSIFDRSEIEQGESRFSNMRALAGKPVVSLSPVTIDVTWVWEPAIADATPIVFGVDMNEEKSW